MCSIDRNILVWTNTPGELGSICPFVGRPRRCCRCCSVKSNVLTLADKIFADIQLTNAMRFARVNDILQEAAPGAHGLCPGCLQPVLAKCGTQKVHHWAHKGTKACDSWWEPETEWHRAWKNNFPAEWQEIFLPDERTGEKHIADVRTSQGLVIEFQHSHIQPRERTSREKFYRNMVWVVDSTIVHASKEIISDS